MKKRFVVIYFALALSALMAQASVLKGTILGCQGKTLELRTMTDGILQQSIVVDTTIVDKNNEFSFSFETSSVRRVTVNIGNRDAVIFVEPDSTYEVEFPAYTDLTEAQRLDPFFKKQEFVPQFLSHKEKTLTEWVVDFDELFDYYYYQVALQPTQENVQKSLTAIQQRVPDDEGIFMQEYRAFQELNLRHLQKDLPIDSIISKMEQLPLAVENPAFWELFNQVFDNFFTTYWGREEQLYLNRALREYDFRAMDAILRYRFGMEHPQLREMVILKGLWDLYLTPSKKAQAVAVVKAWQNDLSNEYTTRILKGMMEEMNIADTGIKTQDFSLPTATGETINLHDLAGQYVLLNFCNTAVSLSTKNLALVARYADIYKKDLVVLSIVSGYKTASETKRMTTQYGKKNHLLLFPTNNDVERAYNVRNYPTYLLLNREGKVIKTDFSVETDFSNLFQQQLQQDIRNNKVTSPLDEW